MNNIRVDAKCKVLKDKRDNNLQNGSTLIDP